MIFKLEIIPTIVAISNIWQNNKSSYRCFLILLILLYNIIGWSDILWFNYFYQITFLSTIKVHVSVDLLLSF